MRRFWIVTIAAVCCFTSAASASAQTVDIVTIYQNFIASRVAADRCHTVDAVLDERFRSNLLTVTIRAADAVKQRNPSYTNQQLVNSMSTMANGVRQSVLSDIGSNGCDNAKVQRLLQLYKMHGTMKLN